MILKLLDRVVFIESTSKLILAMWKFCNRCQEKQLHVSRIDGAEGN